VRPGKRRPRAVDLVGRTDDGSGGSNLDDHRLSQVLTAPQRASVGRPARADWPRRRYPPFRATTIHVSDSGFRSPPV
jgi:hypothetical protein